LERPRHPRALADLMAQHALQQVVPVAVQGQPADRGLVEAGDAVEDRGLAGAVGPDDRRDLARPGAERDVVDRHQPAEAHGQVLDLDQGRAHALPRRCTGCKRSDGSRWDTSPRGRNTMISTMARPKTTMR